MSDTYEAIEDERAKNNDRDSVWARDHIAGKSIVASDKYPYHPTLEELANAIDSRDEDLAIQRVQINDLRFWRETELAVNELYRKLVNALNHKMYGR